jgi:alanyl-tRNA synthetase
MKFPESEYRIPFFVENDFIRKRCEVCGSYFWTQKPDLENCGDTPCQEYTFIGKPPTKRSYTLEELREAFLSFFEQKGHTRVSPYPVVARWRSDLFVTIASIADFQPFVTEGIVPPPANPLVVSQPCLRFNDIDSVGLTAGRHYTIFEMGGAHAFNYPEKRVYWKDQTVRFHHQFVTDVLGVKSDLITYKEGVWSGGGNAGPCVEGCVSGLEVSTLVFMQYKVIDDEFIDMPIKIVDTGYGMERFTWLSQGSHSGFHAIYGSTLERIMSLAGLTNIDERLLFESAKYSAIMNVEAVFDRTVLRKRVAERLGMSSLELDRLMVPVESAYAIADHTKALIFMLAEGVVPSNAKAGYLVRLLMRRVYRLLRSLGIESRFFEIVDMQIDRWSPSFPHIKEARNEILEALSVEVKKYQTTLKRGIELSKRIADRLKSAGKREIPIETLAELYDSHGIPPEIVGETVKTEDIEFHIPDNFYAMIAKRHISPPVPSEEVDVNGRLKEKISGFPKTITLYYDDPYIREFKARTLRIIDEKYVVLDRTAFYPGGGGQRADSGFLKADGKRIAVSGVQKVGNVILHEIRGEPPSEGGEITGRIDWDERLSIMRHHTSTHIMIGAVRRVLGEHAWQAGAEKETDRSRLDVSHWERITHEQVEKIERLANSVVVENIPVEVSWMPREEAEKTYGFRLYQGGVVPGRKIRVVRIGDWDVEACGGTHLRTTGEIGFIKILHTERIQDGVERIIFASGSPAISYIQEVDTYLNEVSEVLKTPKETVVKAAEDTVEKLKNYSREIVRLNERLAEYRAEAMLEKTKEVDKVALIAKEIEDSDVDSLIRTASLLTRKEPRAVAALCSSGETVRIVVMAGDEAVKSGVNAGTIASEMAKVVGGGGSGTPDFGQGGGVKVGKAAEALSLAEEIVKKQVSMVNP